MKTLTRMIWRYIVSAALIVILVLAVNLVLFGTLALRYSQRSPDRSDIVELSDHFAFDETGAPALDDAGRELLQRWEWAMLLDAEGNVIWQWRLPAELDRHYTVGDVAGFKGWYLDDYPVRCWRTGSGLLVTATPRGSEWKSGYVIDQQLMYGVIGNLGWVLLANLAVVVLLCLRLGWRGSRQLKTVAEGVEQLAEGKPVSLPEKGMTAELAGRLNQTSRRLQSQSELIARRDAARTNWIAGVSHDIRTPLALIAGYAEQLAADDTLAAPQREKASRIHSQSLRIKTLVEDLNLTSKLQYNAQPLRRAPCRAGALLRGCVADFCNSGTAGQCQVELDLGESADAAVLDCDAALLRRALENLLNNAARHNPGGCRVTVRAVLSPRPEGPLLLLDVADDGQGYPEAVLELLRRPDGAEDAGGNAPHILGLHVVQQIIAAHGGRVRFAQDTPCGAWAGIELPALPPQEGAGAAPGKQSKK